jgi:uncharacterized protein
MTMGRCWNWQGQVDVVLIGMGPQIAALPAGLRMRWRPQGLGVEIMDSPAACRTYNVLLSEGRRVAVHFWLPVG